MKMQAQAVFCPPLWPNTLNRKVNESTGFGDGTYFWCDSSQAAIVCSVALPIFPHESQRAESFRFVPVSPELEIIYISLDHDISGVIVKTIRVREVGWDVGNERTASMKWNDWINESGIVSGCSKWNLSAPWLDHSESWHFLSTAISVSLVWLLNAAVLNCTRLFPWWCAHSHKS